jgi:DNA modification methylase
MCGKLHDVLDDIGRSASRQTKILTQSSKKGKMVLLSGSCLSILPTLPERHYDVIVTSPPYCNRYDYTRTYALENAILGLGESDVTNLRQEMLSCTVENRAKDLMGLNPKWKTAVGVAENQKLLQSVLEYLETMKDLGGLNNNGIPRMVRGYFYEMACVVSECSRILKPGSYMFMVNDNVKYAGASISVDMIISNMAENLGFEVANIFVLPNGKGNSSQQMGKHGREVLRKCVYVWRKK